MSNAREFLDEVADILRSKGRVVEVTETEETFGTFVWMYSPAPHWYDRTISLSAVKSNRSNRWSLGEMKLGSTGVSSALVKTTRTSMKIAADVYAA